MNIKILKLTGVVCLSIMLVSCFSLKREYQHRDKYLLDVKLPAKEFNKPKVGVLVLNNPTVVAQFSGSGFVYRVSAARYLSDYYNYFFVPVDQQVGHLAEKYFAKTNLFAYVGENSLMHADYNLQIKVEKIYADYRNTQNPRAVLAVRFILLKSHDNKRILLLNKVYNSTIILQKKDSVHLVHAWGKGLQKILYSCNKDIKRIIKK